MRQEVEFHDQIAADWPKKYQKRSFKSRLDCFHRAFEEIELSGTHWLDAGCGAGTLSKMLTSRGCTVHGVDASPQMIREAATMVSREGGCVATFEQVETIERLPMAACSYDGILCSSVLEYLESPELCLQEFFRVLRPGGWLLISVPNRLSLVRRVQLLVFHGTRTILSKPWPAYLEFSCNQYSSTEFDDLLRVSGFDPLRSSWFSSPFATLDNNRLTGALILSVARKHSSEPSLRESTC